jgi:hypothetical protein
VRAAFHRRSINPSLRREAHQPKENVMNFLGTRTAVTRLNAGGMIRRYLPTVSALLYPGRRDYRDLLGVAPRQSHDCRLEPRRK